MNNLKDFLYESILDGVDSKIDNEQELNDAVNNALLNEIKRALGFNNKHIRRHVDYEFDSKTKTFSVFSNTYEIFYLGLVYGDGEVLIYNREMGNTPLRQFTDKGVKFDCNLSVSTDCINHGLKLSQCAIVGKNHILKVHDGGDAGPVNINRFIDINPSTYFDTIRITAGAVDFQQSANMISKFKGCIINPRSFMEYDEFDQCISEIKGMKCRVMYINGLTKFPRFRVGLSRASIKNFIKKDKLNDDGSSESNSLLGMCDKFLTQNPYTTLLVGLDDDITEVCLSKDGEIMCKEIHPKRSGYASQSVIPWGKIR